MDSHPEDEVWTMWHAQAAEDQSIQVDEVRTNAERLNAKVLRWRLISTPLFILLVIIEGWQVWAGREMVERTGDLLTIAALMYVGYGVRKHYAAVSPVALGGTDCVEFYRAELVRQRELSSNGRGFILPFVPGVTLSLLSGIGDRTTTQAILLVSFGVALFAGVAWWNARTVRKLQAEIDTLLVP